MLRDSGSPSPDMLKPCGEPIEPMARQAALLSGLEPGDKTLIIGCFLAGTSRVYLCFGDLSKASHVDVANFVLKLFCFGTFQHFEVVFQPSRQGYLEDIT